MVVIARFTFAYGSRLGDRQLADLTALVGQEIEVDDAGSLKSWTRYEAELERVVAIVGGDAQIVVEGTGEPRPLVELAEQIRAMETRLLGAAARPESYVNTRVDVHVPGAPLLYIDEVKVENDLCTEALQRELEDGWRIVAVCPQPDQRRPDYVLGRRSEAVIA